MKVFSVLLPLLSTASAFSPSSSRRATLGATMPEAVSLKKAFQQQQQLEHASALSLLTRPEEEMATLEVLNNSNSVATSATSTEGEWIDESKKIELILLSIWLVSLSAFILINNFHGPWPLAMKAVPERVFFLSHMIGGMLFGGGIILTTCIERLVAKSANAPVLQFWFDKVPLLDGLIVVPALTVSMVSGTGLSIVRYGGLNIAPPHVGAIFWTLIAFMSWWAVTDLTTQGSALTAVNEMYSKYQQGDVEGLETPKVVVDRHVSNVVSCFFVVLLYSMMVLKPGTFFPFPWN
eukprot:CAMPEP_0113560420 /NCGR_PEP_ID=MMETSP0015_2-20120614/19420_1 /TAXON_ID=2838 /ORGANISM="Odontella" /LENGTH=292 /DNA_ID=CAMNT_0000462121 /DNA_START=314 /DNA_END=1192 /DNA_ORIENTATION=- /assembly_acc=CAM_ASM_000160